MKILIYGLNYYPELTGIGKYNGEMAAWLANKGHDIRVIAAPPYYPSWKVFSGYSGYRYTKKIVDGVTVFRAPIWVPDQPRGFKRIVHLASFAMSSIPVLVMQWRWKPDVVWVVEPPLMCSPAALLFSKLIGAKTWLHIQDYEVNAAFEMGLLKGRRLRALVESCERWLLKKFDRVSTISNRMLDLAGAKGVDYEKSIFFPNWVDISSIRPLGGESTYRTELGIPSNSVVALYSGNMGGKQGLEILADVARIMQNKSLTTNIEFIFCGQGSGRADLEERCSGLTNVRFLDLQPFERLGDLLGAADIHLLPQRADAADLVMPSKLSGMLASGRAVVATASPMTELGRVVSSEARCGIIVEPENADAFASAIEQLAFDVNMRTTMGSNGRVYAEKKLDKDSVLFDFVEELTVLAMQK